jgi:uncharacterized protein (TIGR00255 family)
MIKSMTGFGKAVEEFPDKTITVEVRSLNSKQMDLNLRLSSSYREKELELRADVTRLLERGKVDLSVHVEYRTEQSGVTINNELAKIYYAKLKSLAAEVNEKDASLFDQVLKMPDVIKGERKEFDEKEWNQVKNVVTKAIASMQQFRDDEGKSLDASFQANLKQIDECLVKIENLDAGRIASIRERIQKNLNEFVPAENIDKNRFEQELIYYLEKIDISEEKVRLKTHLDYFRATMKEPSCGRKLNFISQEIGREINTIGSKANDASIQKLVVQMKDELEKIKEQSMNVL